MDDYKSRSKLNPPTKDPYLALVVDIHKLALRFGLFHFFLSPEPFRMGSYHGVIPTLSLS